MRIDVEDDRSLEMASPKSVSRDEGSIARSLSEPTAFTDLESFLAGKRKILVAINDHTRPTPTGIVLGSLDLEGKEVTTIVGTGTHRSPCREELAWLLGGQSPPYGGKILVHDSRDYNSQKFVGRTSRGTELLFSRHLFEADGIIVVGSVEPHYFAGFTGGRKFLMPGLAGFRSIERNHALALDEGARVLALDGNPVHEDFMEALDIFDRYDDIFSVQLVLNAEHEVCYSSSGHVTRSFMEAVERAKDVYVTKVEEKADIVISVAKPPMDLDLYQSQKAIDNVKLALKDGGILILVSGCIDGVGDRGFYDLLASGRDISKKTSGGYRFGIHKAAKIAELLKRANIWAVTNLPQDLLKAISIRPYVDVQTALNDATKLKGKDSRIQIVFDGGLTVPVPKQ